MNQTLDQTKIADTAPEFTDSQKKAIYTRGKDLLVSAGAGSGKTTVLTKRLIERIKSGDSLEDFLVVTFMSSAAADIKRKLYDALLKESVNDPDNTHIYRQMLLVSEADICTISAYCLRTVKENFALLGISPKVRTIDETESLMMLRRAANDIISKGFENSDSDIIMLSDNFSSEKSDDALIDQMISLFLTLRVTLGWKELLSECADNYRKDAEIVSKNGFFSSESGSLLRARLVVEVDEILSSAREMYEFASTVATDDKYLEPIQIVLDKCEALRASLGKDYVNFSLAAYEASLTVSLKSSGCDKEYRDIIKKQKETIVNAERAIFERYCRGNDKTISESLIKTASIVSAIRSFLVELEREYEELKYESNAVDYTDFEAKTLELLETEDEEGRKVPTELCLKKQSMVKEILIDEYQDVNPMQDRIFSLLAGKSHRFMVGDVKQSIYRFRNAYPDIFLGYKEEYADIVNSDNSENAKIFLRENFRCATTVINYVNYVFENVTQGTSYAREYDGEWLVHASKRPEKGTPVVLAVAEKQPKMAKEARKAEAEYIAREILRLVNTETSDEGTPYSFSDVCVMLSAMKGYSIEYEKAFQKYGIPYKKEKSENFLDNPDIRLAISALKAIDDPTDDISLCALMRSPVCRFSSEDLYRIRRALPKTPFWEAVLITALPSKKRIAAKKFRFESHFGEKCLAVRSKAFVKRLTEWRKASSGIPCCDFLKSFFVDSGLLRISVSSGNRASLLLLYDYAKRFENARNHGLSGFIDYLNELSETGKNISDVAKTGDDNAVSFITIHKSKGLEYKICFLACTDRGFMGMDSSDRIKFIRGEGISFCLRDRVALTTYEPMCNVLAVDNERDAIVAEELRKLYVALTRAKERLYITGCAPSGWKEKIFTPASAKCWLDMAIYVSNLGETKFCDRVDISEVDGGSGYIPPESAKVFEPTEDMLGYISFEYPYKSSVSSAAKISVSELREGLLEDDEYNRTRLTVPASRVSLKPAFAQTVKYGAGDIGTANHLFMQFADFASAEKDVRAETERLIEKRMLSTDQAKMLDISALEKFFESELYARIKSSPRVYREKRFSVRDVISENGEPILVQGVIDCFFENPDGTYTVVDYKTDRVKTLEELVSRHRVQLSCYKSAVERMTGCSVSESLLYSFALGGEVSL